MYGEDLDWCYRIQQAGWKIYYTPETQIIHYKGESTKKGELRYVRLFYGAMLRFTEKHFQNRYSRLFAHLLRLGIVARAGLTVLGRSLRRAAGPLADFLLVYAAVALLGIAYSLQRGTQPALLYFVAVAPAYALGTMAGVGAAGGYLRSRRRRLRPAWTGALVGLLLVAATSFFVKEMAFSRVVVLLSYPCAALLLSVRRLAGRTRTARDGLTRRALVVGRAAEANRLKQRLDTHPAPPFAVVGYVEPTQGRRSRAGNGASCLPRLGTLRQLRDLVRLRGIDDVIFAADGLSYGTMFSLVQQLRDLPVQFRILAEGRDHVIGKSSIDDLSMASLIEAEAALGLPRSALARRAFELPLALLGLALHPLVAALGRAGGPGSFFGRLARHTACLPAVLTGRWRLVGYPPETSTPPPAEWDLKPGVFPITGAWPPADPDALQRACWAYVRHQSASHDWDIIVRAIASLRAR